MLDLILVIGCIFLILYVLKYGFFATISLLSFLSFLGEGLIGHWKIILAIVIFLNVFIIFINKENKKQKTI